MLNFKIEKNYHHSPYFIEGLVKDKIKYEIFEQMYKRCDSLFYRVLYITFSSFIQMTQLDSGAKIKDPIKSLF